MACTDYSGLTSVGLSVNLGSSACLLCDWVPLKKYDLSYFPQFLIDFDKKKN